MKPLILVLTLCGGFSAWWTIQGFVGTARSAWLYKSAQRRDSAIRKAHDAWVERAAGDEAQEYAASVWRREQREVESFQDGLTLRQILDPVLFGGPTPFHVAAGQLPAKTKELLMAGGGGIAATVAGVLALLFL